VADFVSFVPVGKTTWFSLLTGCTQGGRFFKFWPLVFPLGVPKVADIVSFGPDWLNQVVYPLVGCKRGGRFLKFCLSWQNHMVFPLSRVYPRWQICNFGPIWQNHMFFLKAVKMCRCGQNTKKEHLDRLVLYLKVFNLDQNYEHWIQALFSKYFLFFLKAALFKFTVKKQDKFWRHWCKK
jgi:hypothetical protein